MIVERDTGRVRLWLALAAALAVGTLVSTMLSVDLWLALSGR